MIKIDGVNYRVAWKSNDLKRKFEIINGDNSGRLQGNKDMYLEYVGTFHNYEATIHRDRDCSDEEWYRLFGVLSNPINDHTVTLPFNGTTMTWQFYISSGEQTLINTKFGENKWADSIKITFTAMYAQQLAGGSIRGLD